MIIHNTGRSLLPRPKRQPLFDPLGNNYRGAPDRPAIATQPGEAQKGDLVELLVRSL